MEFPLNYKPTSFSVGDPQFSSYWNPQSSPSFTIAGTPASSFADGGAAFQNYLNSNIAPVSAFGNSGDAYGTVGGAGTDPYEGMSPDMRGMLTYLERQQKQANDQDVLDKQMQKFFEFRKKEGTEAAKLQALMSVPKIISNAGKDIAMAIANPARLKILADIPANIAPILQQGTASAGQILASSNAGISDMRFFR
jgi:hypothetical protein